MNTVKTVTKIFTMNKTLDNIERAMSKKDLE
jgi:hypothetical protein